MIIKRKKKKNVDDHSRLPPGFSTTDAKEADEVAVGLAAIYGDRPDKEERSELGKIEQGTGHTWLFVLGGILATLVLLAGTAWAGFWWWSGRVSKPGVHVNIEGPSRVSIGQQTSFFVNWFNDGREPVASVELRVSLPVDFSVASLEPEPSEKSGTSLIYKLGAQAAEARGTVKITGTVTGSLGSESAIQVIAVSRMPGAVVGTETLATYPLIYADSVIDGALEVPAKVLPGDHVMLTYRVTNRGSDPLEGLEARIAIPEGFTASGTVPLTANGRAYRIPLVKLDPGAATSIALTGSFALGVHGDTVVHAETGRPGDGEAFAVAQAADATVSVLPGDLSVKLIVNGSDKDRSVSLGERQRIAISYQNMSGEELQNVILRVRLGGEPPITSGASTTIDLVNWLELDDSGHGLRNHDILTYGEDQIAQLERLPKDGEGLIELSVPFVSKVTSTRDVPIIASVEAIIGTVDKVKVNRLVRTQPITLRLQTDASLFATARFASEEGAPVGSGPLPPVVGSSTKYRVEWEIRKTFHALSKMTVSATLPKGVTFGGAREEDAGTISFDASRNLVTWTVADVAADRNSVLGSFDVILTPSEADAGRFAELLGESRIEFTDATLGEPLLRTASSLDTDLPKDNLAKGKGVVKKP